MIVVHLRGGLGNQMFQYALYIYFKERQIPVAIDLSHFTAGDAATTYSLEAIFGIKARTVGSIEKIWVKAGWKLLHSFFKMPYKEQDVDFGIFNPRVPELRFAYLKGYWQTEQYFMEVANQVRQAYRFTEPGPGLNSQLLQLITASESVSVHIRRGDYLTSKLNAALPITYYRQAVEQIRQAVPGAIFFVFSDDAQWAAENLALDPAHFVNWNTGSESYRDMQLMSRCKHHIIANSSFSWWAAWLNTNPAKQVMAPGSWLPWMEGTRDILPQGWTIIPC